MPASVIPVSGIKLGFVGQISNEGLSLRTPRKVKSNDTNGIAYGETVVLNTDNTYSSMKTAIAGGLTPDDTTPFAIAVSNVHTNLGFPTMNAAGKYVANDDCDAMVQGTINVFCANGTPTAGGIVYLRKVANGAIPAGVVGGLEAVGDSTNTVALDPLKIAWKTGVLETDGTCQVTLLARMIP